MRSLTRRERTCTSAGPARRRSAAARRRAPRRHRRFRDLGDSLRHAGPEHPGNPVGSVRIGRIALVELLGQLHLGRIDVGDREALDRALVAQCRSRTNRRIRERRARHLLQSRAVVDQRRQRLARFGEEAQRRFGAATLGHVERDRDHRPWLALGAADRRQGDGHPDTVALVAAVAQVERLAVGSAGEQRLDRGAGARAIVGVHEVEKAGPDQILALPRHHLAEAGIRVEQHAVEPGASDSDRGLPDDSAVALLAVAQRLLDQAPLAHVSSDRGGADHLASGAEDWRDGDRGLDPTAVLAHPDRLVVLDALPASEAGEDATEARRGGPAPR